jgi:hypothetical protein
MQWDIGSAAGPAFSSIQKPNNMVAGYVLNSTTILLMLDDKHRVGRLKSSHGLMATTCITADLDSGSLYFHLADPDGTNWQSMNSGEICRPKIIRWWQDYGFFLTNVSTPPKQQDKNDYFRQPIG